MYKMMAQDMNQELRRSSSSYQNEIRCHQKRAEESWMAAEFTQRKFQNLWRENDHIRLTLAKVESQFQPFTGVPSAPPVPPAAHRGPEVQGPFAPASPPTVHWGPEGPDHRLGHWVPMKKVIQ
uniref:Uncharacterized protein n=1 Tax=Molossus molossus TaxID=27622 RepID=A0A7J8FRP7_MOLMO|nr:hypothetical protein HJG59_008331 [Molossus molossus]